ncbi:MRG-domain-containing protein [Pyronema domesticum]|uniref:Chromatin modification-related protein EAF3 n=1 Tax=Pyronema omphalodes (strain CBS 100304) TaxID=1076935 RepID=U4L4P4_PYROM|nr:MRG-domain-containing protein [Pyronema domesticum]CCX11469.1 Similar to Chromatin modification-related protein eaf3; acc. no. Q5BBV4 [Pyronema omphalodes CBS 100304]
MPPAAAAKPVTYDVQERVLCFHGPMLYEAKVLEVRKPEDKKEQPEYKVHYKGWKNTWDEFVPADRLRKINEENLRMQKELNDNSKPSKPKPAAATKAKPSKAGSEDPIIPARGQKRGREIEIEKEEDYMKRHDVKIAIPDVLKAYLVDDWENVTKNQQLVPLPKELNVVTILEKYRAATPKKRPGSAEADIFDEIVAGLKLYFDKSLGTILLYRFERQQFLEIRKEHPNKEPSEIYGAEHLLRLCVSMPELLAHTNMDSQAMGKLRDHIEEFVKFLAKNPEQYIASPYESASPRYIDLSRGQ